MTTISVGPWRRGLDSADVAAVRAMVARVRAVDRRGPDEIPGSDVDVLLARVDGVPAGVAWRRGTDPAELFVDPDRRRRGVGAALAAQLGAGGIWAHGTLAAAAALACSVGAVPTRTMLQLRRDLTGPFLVELPERVRMRTAVPGQDDAALIAVNGRAFAWHPEQGRLDVAGLREQMAQPWFDPAGLFLAVADGSPTVAGGQGPAGVAARSAVVAETGERLLGFHWTKVHAADPTPPEGVTGPVGEVYVLAVDPESPVRRLGTPLTVAGMAHLAAAGLSTVMLYVESDNDAALKLYRRLGFADYAVDTVFARP